jgi:hypothetical protein
VGRGWLICGWCGTSQIVKQRGRRTFKQYAGIALFLQAFAIVAATMALGVAWSRTGWSVERAQMLGVIWIGVLLILAFLAWVSVNVGRTQERPPLFGPFDRQTT